MPDELKDLHSTMLLVETKGNSTKLMALCLNKLECLIRQENAKGMNEALAQKAKDAKRKDP